MTSLARRNPFPIFRPNLGSTTEDLFLGAKTSGAADQFRGGMVTVVTEGLVQGVGSITRKSEIHITTDASGVPTAATVTGATGSAGVAHTATITGGEVQIKFTFTAGSPGQRLAHYIFPVGSSLIFDAK